jgi:hypothetical protein
MHARLFTLASSPTAHTCGSRCSSCGRSGSSRRFRSVWQRFLSFRSFRGDPSSVPSTWFAGDCTRPECLRTPTVVQWPQRRWPTASPRTGRRTWTVCRCCRPLTKAPSTVWTSLPPRTSRRVRPVRARVSSLRRLTCRRPGEEYSVLSTSFRCALRRTAGPSPSSHRAQATLHRTTEACPSMFYGPGRLGHALVFVVFWR